MLFNIIQTENLLKFTTRIFSNSQLGKISFDFASQNDHVSCLPAHMIESHYKLKRNVKPINLDQQIHTGLIVYTLHQQLFRRLIWLIYMCMSTFPCELAKQTNLHWPEHLRFHHPTPEADFSYETSNVLEEKSCLRAKEQIALHVSYHILQFRFPESLSCFTWDR